MSVITVGNDELFEIIQYVNLIRAKFDTDVVWTVYPVLYSSFDNIDIISGRTNLSHVSVGQKVSFKFQKHGYEYIVEGEVAEISFKNSATVTIKFLNAKKYYNLRKHIRFEVELCSQIIGSTLCDGINTKEQCFKATVLNLSKGGAMVTTNADFSVYADIEISVTFASEVCFTTKARILRKQYMQDRGYNYGIQFINISEENLKILNKEIEKLEQSYFNSLREYKKSSSSFDTKFAIFSTDADESYDIREVLVKLGEENFDIVSNFKFYFGFISEEKPKFIILDLSTIDEQTDELIRNIKSDFPKLEILIILPIEYQRSEEFGHILNEYDVLFKPLIYNEFEDKIIKYL